MSVLVRDAKALARRWVEDEAASLPGFVGAYLAGSATWLSDDAPLPDTSDLDVNVVLAEGVGPRDRVKLLYGGTLLEASYIPVDLLRTPEAVLADYHLAGAFRTPSVILDPTGRISEIQAAVSERFADPQWVRKRCEHARAHVLRQLDALDSPRPNPERAIPERAIGILFPTGVTTHVLLVAGLRNPTVRRRYAEARRLLDDYGHLGFHEELLDLLGCARMTRERVEQHLATLAEAFDAACGCARTPFPFSADLTKLSRPIAIDGSRELIEQGLHLEAVFWIAVTHSRCQAVLAADAPDLAERHAPAYLEMLAELGIGTPDEVRRRAEEVRSALPRVWAVAEEIMARNPRPAPATPRRPGRGRRTPAPDR